MTRKSTESILNHVNSTQIARALLNSAPSFHASSRDEPAVCAVSSGSVTEDPLVGMGGACCSKIPSAAIVVVSFS